MSISATSRFGKLCQPHLGELGASGVRDKVPVMIVEHLH